MSPSVFVGSPGVTAVAIPFGSTLSATPLPSASDWLSIIPSLSASVDGSTFPPSTRSVIPSPSESVSWKFGVPLLSVSGTGNVVTASPSATVVGLSAVAGFLSTTSARPSPSVSVASSTLPSKFVSTPPASWISRIPSLSESRSSESITPSPSVSLVGSPFSSITSGIPSLSSSISVISGIPSKSVSFWTVIVTVAVASPPFPSEIV